MMFRSSLVIAALTTSLTAAGCSKNSSSTDAKESTSTPAKNTIVLVHGAFADHHAFDAVRPSLEKQGYRVITPDLPGHGQDTTPVKDITLDLYVDAIGKIVSAEKDPVVLVGHSMAGMVVSAVAERHPDKVAQLVYVAAYLPQNGDTLLKLAEADKDSLVGQNLEFAPDYSTATIKKDRVIEAIGADVSADIQAIILESQRPEPAAPFQGAVTLSSERFGSVPKAYIATTQDRAVTHSLQTRLLAGYPEIRVVEMATSHLPFIAKPDEFVRALTSFIESR